MKTKDDVTILSDMSTEISYLSSTLGSKNPTPPPLIMIKSHDRPRKNKKSFSVEP